MMMAWPEDSAGAPWMTRFLAVLRKHDRLSDYGFLSFEWYPFDDVCSATAPQLASAPGRLTEALRRLHEQGVPRTLPLVIAEYGYSAFADRAEVDIEGRFTMRIWWGISFRWAAAAAYLYGYEPTYLDRDPRCACVGQQRALVSRPAVETFGIRWRHITPMRLVAQEWLELGIRVDIRQVSDRGRSATRSSPPSRCIVRMDGGACCS